MRADEKTRGGGVYSGQNAAQIAGRVDMHMHSCGAHPASGERVDAVHGGCEEGARGSPGTSVQRASSRQRAMICSARAPLAELRFGLRTSLKPCG